MTVATLNTFSGPYSATGGLQAFPFDFRAQTGAEVGLIVDGVAVTPTDVVINESGVGGTASTIATAGAAVYVASLPSFQQNVDLSNQAAIFPLVINEALDRSTLRDQYLAEAFDRSIKVPLSESLTPLPKLTDRAGKVLAFDTFGNPATGPNASQLQALIDTAYSPSLTTLGDAVTFLAAGAGAEARSIQDKARERLSLMDFIPAGLRANIRAGTNVTVLTAYMTAAVTACPDGGTIYIEAGKYRGLLTIPTGKNVSIEGDGDATVLEATVAGVTVLDRIGDTRREGGSRISKLRVDGRSLGSVTGIKLGNQTGGDALLQQSVADVTAENCYAGIELGNIQESNFTNVTCQFNTVGMLGESDLTGGGITTLLFSNVHWQQNQVGLFMKSNSPFPMSSWLFNQCLAQNNSLCGISLHGAVSGKGLIYGVNFNILHMEANGTGTSPGDTLLVRSRTVERAGFHAAGVVATVSGGQLGESLTDLRTFVLNTNSRITFVDGELGGGDKTNVECDKTSRVFLEGRVGITGRVNGVLDFSGAYLMGPGSLQGKPRRNLSTYPRNLYGGAGLNPNAPEAESAVGCTPSKVLDIDRGDVQQVIFAGSVGSTGSNRVIFKPITVPVAIGDQIAIEVDIWANVDTEITLYPLGADGSNALRGPQSFPLYGGEWTCVVLFGVATTVETLGYDLYAYPTLADGRTIRFSEMGCVRVVTGGDLDPVHDMVRRGLYDDMKQPVYATGIPASGTWARGRRIINSAPAVGAARAWVKVTTGAANVLGTDWINEGNL